MFISSDRFIIGVTGQMGAGKSTVSGFFKEWGSLVIDADLVAHELVDKPEVLFSIENQFGCKLNHDSAYIRRSKIAAVVFENRDSLDLYYKIIKNPLTKLLKKKIEQATLITKIVVFDAPLLFEWELDGLVDSTVSVGADHELCIKRVMDRSLLSRSEIEDRISLQFTSEIKNSRADFFIKNDDSIEGLRKRAQVVWDSLQTV